MSTRLLCPPCLLLLLWSATLAATPGVDQGNDRSHLLFHVETGDGKVLASQGADRLFNPASVVKVGTTLWALERLGPDYRYETAVGIDGSWDREAGTVAGRLLVVSSGDPDFHCENAFLIAGELNRLGISTVTGGLDLVGPFTFGWEHGVARRQADELLRSRRMGRQLIRALDPQQWDRSTREGWLAACERRGWDETRPPRVVVRGPVVVGGTDDTADCTVLVRHRSNCLPVLLRRFNIYSNNDIIRVADGLGGAAALEHFLQQRLGARPEQLQITTASGEEYNRISSRLVVRLLRELAATAAKMGLAVTDLLPVPGCDPGPVPKILPSFASGSRARSLVCKTGTLRQQDRGVAVLAGYFSCQQYGEVFFSVAARNAGYRLGHWRRVEESWLQDLMARSGAAHRLGCAEQLPFSDSGVIIRGVERQSEGQGEQEEERDAG